MVEIGSWKIQSVVNGHVRLDGGAMFGVVPRPLWSKYAPPDDLNRIHLATRTLLASHQRSGRILLVDTGTGSKWSSRMAERYGVEPIAGAVDGALRDIGADRAAVTDIVATHLHFDHCGGMTDWIDEPEGPTCLRYPRATHWVHRRHWEHAHRPTLRDRASFLVADFAAVAEQGRLSVVERDDDTCPIDDITWQVSNGHTPAQLHPRFEGGSGPDLLFVGDVIPTRTHLPAAWVMAYDLDPVATVNERLAIHQLCRDEGLLLAFPHDLDAGIVSIGFEKDSPAVEEILG
jgi:glyoxylase-like metal-dependent hydrolase (beta-lactamase superfamily II)